VTLPMSLIEAARKKRPVFTVSAGRSGTKFLAKLLGLFPDTAAHHEPSPSFVHAMRHAQSNPEAALAFVRDHKLGAIARTPEARYVETSHLFGKGFAEAFIRLGVVPDVVILRRHPREIALSLLRMNSVPARTGLGVRYLLQPDDPGVLPFPGWTHATNYQLCFWYALEMERRQDHYAGVFRTLGTNVVESQLADLLDFESFRTLAGGLGFLTTAERDLDRRYAEIAAVKHNSTGRGPVQGADQDLDAAEAFVWDRTFFYDALLFDRVMPRYQDTPRLPDLDEPTSEVPR